MTLVQKKDCNSSNIANITSKTAINQKRWKQQQPMQQVKVTVNLMFIIEG
jgi:flagellar basal body rod protein FlgC